MPAASWWHSEQFQMRCKKRMYGDVAEPMPIESRVVASGTIAISSGGESSEMVMEMDFWIAEEWLYSSSRSSVLSPLVTHR